MIKTKKRLYFMAALGFLLLIAGLNTLRAQSSRIEDGVAAVINDQIITLIDVKIVERFGLYHDEIKNAALPAILDGLVGQKIVIDYSRGRTVVGGEEINAALKDLILRMGSESFRRGLEEFGLEESDLAPYLQNRLLFRKVLSARFSQSVPVSLNEMEEYYRTVYLPAQEKAGAEALPLIQILDRIEADIQGRKRNRRIAAWIDSLRAQVDIRINRDCLK